MTQLPRLIGIVGYQRAGKTTTAKLIQRIHDYHWTRFAGPLKEMLRCLGLDDYWLDGAGKNRPCPNLGGKTPVEAMQTLGTDWGRDMVSKTLWSDAWKERAATILALGGRVVVDDVRFETEARLVRDLGGELWRVTREGYGRASDHPSEEFAGVAQVDWEYLNPGDMEGLHKVIEGRLGQ